MSFRRNVALLACCQALLLTNNVTLISVGALAGYALAHDKVFATAPQAAYVIGALLGTFPASMWMRRVGRRNGFLTGGVFGLAGSALATYAIASASLPLLCAGTLLIGIYNASGQYYRFAAADSSPLEFRPKAISYMLAGGLVGGLVGPEISKYTRLAMEPMFMATYGSLFVYCVVAMAIVSRLQLPPLAEVHSDVPARPLAEIARQPVFLVAAGVAALGYGTMNLLMTATPLAMGFCGLPYSASATVIGSHVIAMFAPSFFTGSLIKRFGVLNVMLAGAACQAACVAIALSGQLVAHFWWALVLLGLGWNFLYIGGTTLLTEAYRPSERAKVQGANEVTIFSVQAVSAFSSGVLVNARGWATLNHVALPLIAVGATAIVWLMAHRIRAARGSAAQ